MRRLYGIVICAGLRTMLALRRGSAILGTPLVGVWLRLVGSVGCTIGSGTFGSVGLGCFAGWSFGLLWSSYLGP